MLLIDTCTAVLELLKSIVHITYRHINLHMRHISACRTRCRAMYVHVFLKYTCTHTYLRIGIYLHTHRLEDLFESEFAFFSF